MAGKPKPHSDSSTELTNPWDKVQVRNGKLVGILTDDLANNILPKQGGRESSTQLPNRGDLGVRKVHKKLPSKFK